MASVTQLQEFEAVFIPGESIDFSVEVPLAYQPYEVGVVADNPLDDGSYFTCSFKLESALAGSPASIIFDSRAQTPPLLGIGDWVSPLAKQVLAFQASVERVRQMAIGVYLGDVLHHRPRSGPLGDMSTRVARIKLTIEQGTE